MVKTLQRLKVKTGQLLREKVMDNGRRLYHGLRAAGFDVGPHISPVVAVQLPSPEIAIAFWNALQAPVELTPAQAYQAQDASGNLVVSVKNDTSVQIRGVAVLVQYSGASGQSERRRYDIVGQIPPGQIASVNTGLGPYTAGSNCPVEIVSAQIAE